MHADCPVAFWYLPASHKPQTAVPLVDVALPGKQSPQTATLELPGTGFAFPTGQPMQAVLLLEPVRLL